MPFPYLRKPKNTLFLIPKHTIDQIMNVARIEEIVGEFVNLKKSGSNFKGLSPFTDEKTPSFMVSPAKQIFKDFSSGKGGSVVTFLMEHEHYTYPEALRFLAKRYNIEIPEEEELTDEQKQEQSERESLYIVNSFAQEYFEQQLWDTDEGKSVGLGYFKERDFKDETIKKFSLGYNPEGWENLVNAAKEKGYKTEYLVTLGLAKQKEERIYDTYRGRVMFPIQNLSGRVIGFGGRTLKTDKKIPKYINSPESLIYNKSQSLYGLYQSKSDIIKNDLCYLVEGYTDVISLHQKSIENVVASSGTSLTEQQIRLIKRYTQNVVILYDGDAAGIKASFRGIDMLLEQGLNIKVVLFPDGEDPDSFAKNNTPEDLKAFLEAEAKDFIVFKTSVLTKDAKDDPLKKAGLLKEVVKSVALIPDHLTRAVYIKECAKLLDVEERSLVLELNKIRRDNYRDQQRREDRTTETKEETSRLDLDTLTKASIHVDEKDVEPQEKEVVRVLLNYCNVPIKDENLPEHLQIAGALLLGEVFSDKLPFNNSNYQFILEKVAEQLEAGGAIDHNYFLLEASDQIRNVYVDLLKPSNELHDWERKKIFVKSEKEKIKESINSALSHLRAKRLMNMMNTVDQKIKENHQKGEDITELLKEKQKLDAVKVNLSKPLGIVIR